MKEFTIGPNDAGQRLDRFLAKAVPLLPASFYMFVTVTYIMNAKIGDIWGT